MDTPRKLAAILAADIAGYSRLMGLDEAGTAKLLREHRAAIDPILARHGGRIFKTTGDGVLVEFPSIVAAVESALAVQKLMAERNGDVPEDRRMLFRIGINLGDVLIEGDDILGDGVNVAARLEGIAEPGGICISDDSYRQVRGKLDASFEDAGEQQLKNITRPVRIYRVRFDGAAKSAPMLPLPTKPSIAVLAFQNMSGNPEQEYFADGIAEDIITMLSRSQSLFVIARNSSFTYKGRAVDVKQVARELGVRYVLEGSVRRSGNRVRLTAQLIDTITGNHMWGERYDRDLTDVFAIQDEITEAIVIAIEPAVADMEWRRAVRKPPESLDAWEAYQRGLWHMGRLGVTDNEAAVTDNEAAKSFFRRAIDLDPRFAPAHAQCAIAIFMGCALYQTMSIPEALAEGLPMAQRAIALEPGAAVAHVSMGYGRNGQGDYEGMLAAGRQALAISPNYATAHIQLGNALLFSGRPREALESFRRAARLDPHDPLRINRLSHNITAHYFLREYELAVEAGKDTLRSYPDHPIACRLLAAALGQTGRLEEARRALQKAISVAPKSFDMYVRQRAPWVRVEDYEHMLEGLRKAGWEG
jgi:adenylate cyclase